MKELFALIRSLLEGLAPRGRWFAVVVIISMAFAFLFATDYVTGWSYYRALEKRIELLSELQRLDKEGFGDNSSLAAIFDETVETLKSRRGGFSATLPLRWRPTQGFWKAGTGAILWILLGVLAPFGVYGPKQKAVGTFFFLGLSLLFGYLGAVMPIIYRPWVNHVLFPVLQVIVLTIVILWYQKAQNAKLANRQLQPTAENRGG